MTLNTDDNNRYKEVFLVFSSGKREAVKKFLWHKHVWSQLSQEEYLLFLALLTERDEKMWAFLRLLNNESKRTLRTRLNKVEKLLGDNVTSREALEGLYSIRIEFRKERRKLPVTKKFSGYIKSPSAAGSKRMLDRHLDEMVNNETNDYDEKITWYSLLSVDNVSLFSGRAVFGS